MPARLEFPKLAPALAAGAAAALLVWGLGRTRPGRSLELQARDSVMRATVPARGGHPDVAMIIVTEESLDWMHEKYKMSWPWNREAFGVLFSACGRGKASSILFDFFTLVDQGEGEPELVEAMKGVPPVFLAVPFIQTPPRRPVPWEKLDPLLERYSIRVDTDGSVDPGELYHWVKLPRPGIAEAARGACDVTTPEDIDGVIRRYRLFSKFRGRCYPSFALAALMAREGADRVVVRDRVATVGRLSISLDTDATFRLRFYKPGESFLLRVASRVFSGALEIEEKGKSDAFNPGDFNGKIVIVGTNAPGLHDLRVTPVAGSMAGCELHALALANILKGDFPAEIPGALSFLAALLLGLVTAGITRFNSAAAGGAAAAGLLAGYGALNVVFFRGGWIVELAPPLVSVALAFAVVSALNFLTEGRQRRRVKREFARYLSPKVVDKILLNPDGLRMEGDRKVLTIFFMDFAGFTSMSETLDPTELVRLVSQYHNQAAEEIFRTEGTIDKYIGDAIMAFWNDPIDQPDHALRACLTAVGAQRRLRDFAAKMREQGLPEMHARMGINSGIATVGNFGAKGQVNYTVMGDEVNLASRLEGVNKEFGTDIIASEAAYGPAREQVEARELALIKVKGKKHPVRIFELLGPRGEVDPARLAAARAFERGLEAFRARRFEEALGIFRPAAEAGDRAAKVHVELCERYRKEPPPPDWDGSYQMLTK